jgi:hypothetical protein
MENRGFWLMREYRVADIIVEDFNLVFAQPARSAHVEIVGVFIAKLAVLNFCPLALVCSTSSIQVTEAEFGNLPEAALKRGEEARFLKAIAGV